MPYAEKKKSELDHTGAAIERYQREVAQKSSLVGHAAAQALTRACAGGRDYASSRIRPGCPTDLIAKLAPYVPGHLRAASAAASDYRNACYIHYDTEES